MLHHVPEQRTSQADYSGTLVLNIQARNLVRGKKQVEGSTRYSAGSGELRFGFIRLG